MQYLDIINYNIPYTADEIIALTFNEIIHIQNEYLETTLADSATKGLGEGDHTKGNLQKEVELKTTLTDSLSHILKKNKIPLTYLIRKNTINDLNDQYNN